MKSLDKKKPKELEWKKELKWRKLGCCGGDNCPNYEPIRDDDGNSMGGDHDEALEYFIQSLLLQQKKEILGLVKENRKGTFTDDGGNDCWYIDDLVKEIEKL